PERIAFPRCLFMPPTIEGRRGSPNHDSSSEAAYLEIGPCGNLPACLVRNVNWLSFPARRFFRQVAKFPDRRRLVGHRQFAPVKTVEYLILLEAVDQHIEEGGLRWWFRSAHCSRHSQSNGVERKSCNTQRKRADSRGTCNAHDCIVIMTPFRRRSGSPSPVCSQAIVVPLISAKETAMTLSLLLAITLAANIKAINA